MFTEMMAGGSGGGGTFETKTVAPNTSETFTDINNAFVVVTPVSGGSINTEFYRAYIENGLIQTEYYKHPNMSASISSGTLTMSCSYSGYGNFLMSAFKA